MKTLCTVVLIVGISCGPAFAQQGPRIYPGADFPGNDLVDMQSASPDECAAR